MARAKRTDRADARRRYRASQVEQTTAEAPDESVETTKEGPRSGGSLVTSLRGSAGRLRLPDVGADARAIPAIVRSKPWILVPYALLLIGAVAALVAPANGNTLIGYLVSFTLVQPTLLFFAAGFLAPRGAYLFGGILGLLAGVLYVLVVVTHVAVLGDTAVAGSINSASVAFYVATDIVSGAVFGWFASWYRDFLRRTQNRNRENAEKRKRDQARQARRSDSKAVATKRPAR